MKAYAIALIACGSAAVALLILCCLCKVGRKKRPTVTATMTARQPPAPQAYRDVERGEKSKSSRLKDGEMVILAGATAATAAVVISSGGGGGDVGGGDGGDGGGGGGCGGCGGGCGGCGGGCGG